LDLLEWLFAKVRGGEGIVVGGVPVLGEDDVLEMPRRSMDWLDNSVAVGNGECSAGAEVILYVDHDQDVLMCDLH
jgi:hypothetical protein